VRAQTLHEFRPTAARSAAVASDPVHIGASVVSICDSPAFSRKAKEELQDAHEDSLGAIRGLRAAFVLEGGMALLIYGVWQLAHLAR
jgi:hypothetical protein